MDPTGSLRRLLPNPLAHKAGSRYSPYPVDGTRGTRPPSPGFCRPPVIGFAGVLSAGAECKENCLAIYTHPHSFKQEDSMKLLGMSSSRGSRSFPQLLAATGTVLLVLLCAASLRAKQSTSHELTLTPSSADFTAAAAAKNQKIHARPAHTPAGRSTPSPLSPIHLMYPPRPSARRA
jgi:hypothetical protein